MVSQEYESISIILPVFNGAAYLKDAIESALRQTAPALELIVIDDGSSDESATIALSYQNQIRYIRQENQGAAAARNTGIEHAKGDYLAFIDADDLWPTNKLSWQLKVLQSDPTIDIVIGSVCSFSSAIVDSASLSAPFQCYLFGTALMRRGAVEQIGPLDRSLPTAEDVDWFMRAREAGLNIAVAPEVALFYRLHKDSLTARKNSVERNLLVAFKRSLDRRRIAGACSDSWQDVMMGSGSCPASTNSTVIRAAAAPMSQTKNISRQSFGSKE